MAAARRGSWGLLVLGVAALGRKVLPPPGWAKCLEGVATSDGTICCPKTCGKCGGIGCDLRKGGGMNCCASSIQDRCTTLGGPPPCKYKEDWAPAFGLCKKGVLGKGFRCCRRGCVGCGERNCTKRCCRKAATKCTSPEGPPPCFYPRWIVAKAYAARDLDPAYRSRPLDRLGRPFEAVVEGGEVLRWRSHRAPGSDGSVVALTLAHWYGCRHRYHEELGRLLVHFLRWARRNAQPVSEIHVPWLFEFFDLPDLNVHWIYTPIAVKHGVRVLYSNDVPVCCSGADLDGPSGHTDDSPCVRLLRQRQERLQLVRIASTRPLRTHTAGCAEDFTCPGHRNMWSPAPCCMGLTSYLLTLWRISALMPSLGFNASGVALENWPGDELLARGGPAGAFSRYVGPVLHASCASTFLRRLPEVAETADASPVGRPAPWSRLVAGVGTCKRFYHYKFVEHSFDATGFLGRHGVPRHHWRRLPSGRLAVRFCAPAPVKFSEHTGAEPNVHCDASTVATDLVPILLAFLFSSPAAFALAPKPSVADVAALEVPLEPPGASMNEQMELYHAHHSKLMGLYQARASAEPSCTGTGAAASVAVCITGMARSLRRPEVYLSIRDNVSGSFGANVAVRYFHVWHLEDGRLASDFAGALAALPPAEACATCHEEAMPLRLPNLSCASPSCGEMMFDWWRCLRQVERYEEHQGQRFDWIARVRTDTRWFAPVGPLACLDRGRLHLPISEDAFGVLQPYGTHSDRFALVPRHLARAFFGAVWEPAMCGRIHRLTESFRCSVYSQGFSDCQCFLDLRIMRLGVPVQRFPVIFEVVRDTAYLGASGAFQRLKRQRGDS